MEDYTEVHAVIHILGARSEDTTTTVYTYPTEDEAEQQAEELRSIDQDLDPNDENIVQTSTFHVPEGDENAVANLTIVAYDEDESVYTEDDEDWLLPDEDLSP